MRLHCLLLSGCLMLCFVGCGGSNEDRSTAEATQTPAPPPPDDSGAEQKTLETAQSDGSGSEQKTPAPPPPDDSGSEQKTPETPQTGESPAQDASSSKIPAVELLKSGEKPRSELRYKFEANLTEQMVTVVSTMIAVQVRSSNPVAANAQPSQRIPTSKTTMTINGKNITAAGDLQYEFELSAVDILAEPRDNPAIVNRMKQTLEETLGMTGSATVTPRGFTKDILINLPETVNPQLRQMLNNMKQAVTQMSIILPEEPVGKGARWKVTQPMETATMKFTQSATYALVEMEGDQLKLNATVKQKGLKQELKSPSPVKMILESLETLGDGTIEMRLSSMVPRSAIKLKTTNVISANGQRTTTELNVENAAYPQDQ